MKKLKLRNKLSSWSPSWTLATTPTREWKDSTRPWMTSRMSFTSRTTCSANRLSRSTTLFLFTLTRETLNTIIWDLLANLALIDTAGEARAKELRRPTNSSIPWWISSTSLELACSPPVQVLPLPLLLLFSELNEDQLLENENTLITYVGPTRSYSDTSFDLQNL